MTKRRAEHACPAETPLPDLASCSERKRFWKGNPQWKFGFGLLTSFSKDTRMTREWRKLNNEVRVKASVLLAKGYNRRRIDDYMDYNEFSVETTIRIEK